MFHCSACRRQNCYLVLIEELVRLFCSNYWQNPPVTAGDHYFHYNYHHHYHYQHFHYHCKMHLYHLKILLTIPFFFDPLFVSAELCLFPALYFFLVLFQAFFTTSKRTQNSFTAIRHILDVLFIPIFIYIVIYTSSFKLTALLYRLDKIDEMWETKTNLSRFKTMSSIADSMSSIGDNYYLEAATGSVLQIKLFLKILLYSQQNTCVEKRLQHRCLPVHISKFLRALVSKTICKRLLLIILLL